MVNEQIKIECPKCGYEFTEHGIAKEKGYLYLLVYHFKPPNYILFFLLMF